MNVSKCKECFHSLLLHRRSNVKYEFRIDLSKDFTDTRDNDDKEEQLDRDTAVAGICQNLTDDNDSG